MKWKWDKFKPEEVLSPYGIIKWRGKGELLIQPSLLDFLSKFRQVVDKPMLINHGDLKYRGYRDWHENKKVDGTQHSYHMQGLAVDVTVRDMKPEDLYAAAIDFGWKGVGLYDTFVHMDLRNTADVVVWDSRVRN